MTLMQKSPLMSKKVQESKPRTIRLQLVGGGWSYGLEATLQPYQCSALLVSRGNGPTAKHARLAPTKTAQGRTPVRLAQQDHLPHPSLLPSAPRARSPPPSLHANILQMAGVNGAALQHLELDFCPALTRMVQIAICTLLPPPQGMILDVLPRVSRRWAPTRISLEPQQCHPAWHARGTLQPCRRAPPL